MDRDLSIADPHGHARYLGRPLYFGPFHPDDWAAFATFRRRLVAAENSGHLAAFLETGGLGTKEQWWHIEASFYQRHQNNPGAFAAPKNLPPANANDAGRTIRPNSRQPQRRRPRGTPTPELIPVRVTQPEHAVPVPLEAPVTFEVFCELSGAQAAWGAAGKDPIDEAVAHFLLEPQDLVAAELYWAGQLSQSRELAREFARRMLHYKDQFSDG